MKKLSYILRDLLRFKGNTFTKIISLAIGLSVGILSFSYCAFETDYDSFHRYADRIYRIGTTEGNTNIPLTLANEAKREIPEIELTTCIQERIYPNYIYKKQRFQGGDALRADTSFFRLFSYRLLSGDPRDLQYADKFFISDKLAAIIFGNEDPLGKEVKYGNKLITVAGIFENFPRNGHLMNIHAIHPLIQTNDNQWTDKPEYKGYILLTPGTDPDKVTRQIQAIADPHQSEEHHYSYTLQPLRDLHLKYGWGYTYITLVGIMGSIIVLISALNYILISVSSLIQKTKEIGIHKINGASTSNIFTMFFMETVILIIISGLLALGELIAFKPFFENIMYNEYASLFNTRVLITVAFFFVFMIILTGVLPARLFASVPVLQIFRQVSHGRRFWKYILLWIQFFSACLLLTLLIIFNGQYKTMMNKDMGYTMENLYYTQMYCGSPYPSLASVKDEVKRLPFISNVTFSSNLPLWPVSATVSDPNGQGLFQSCVIHTDEDFFSTLQIPILDGDSIAFTGGKDNVWVNEKFREKLEIAGTNATGLVVGKRPITPCGTCRNFHVLSLYAYQEPLTIFRLQEPDTTRSYYLLMRMEQADRQQMKELMTRIRKISNQPDLNLYYYPHVFRAGYESDKDMCTSVLIFSSMAIIIAILGLFGFTGDEVSRRTKEIAIRKVNGASVTSITLLLLRNISLLALLSIPFALTGAYFIGSLWLEEFIYRLPLSIWIFLGGAALTFIVILLTVLLKSQRGIRARPAETLKSE
ncbi:ABC transporter permease [Culturomica massiliensis]|uniref:ABC transporter permease n=1 Tax=Culturomica massiliensis TaxID=1841857 RepID=UPI0008380CF9|nr:ABC transporter permease [Culturomica massiliensis]